MTPDITKENILKAIIELSGNKQMVSLENIRKITGGSNNTIAKFRDQIYQEMFARAHDVSQMLIKFADMESRIAELIALQAESNQLIASLQRRVEECEKKRRDMKSQAQILFDQGLTPKAIAETLSIHVNDVSRLLKSKVTKGDL